MDVLQADAACLGALEAVFQNSPSREQRRIEGLAKDTELIVRVAPMEPGPFQERAIHGHFRAIAVKPEIRLGATLDHGLEEETPGLGALGGKVSAVEHFVADRRSVRVRKVGHLGQHGTAPTCGQLLLAGCARAGSTDMRRH